MKKLAILAMSFLLVGLTACGNAGGNNAENQAGNTVTTAPIEEQEQTEQVSKDPFGKLLEQIEVTMAKSVGNGPPQNMPEGETLTDNQLITLANDTFGVKLTYAWTAQDSAYDQKLKLDIASNKLPDIFMVQNYSDYVDLVKNGMVEDLTEVYKDYASDRIKSLYQSDNGKGLETLTVDGKFYGIPGLGMVDNNVQEVWLRKDWLDKYQVAEPKTLDDLRNIVKVFNEKEGTTGIPGTGVIDGFVNPLDSYDGIFQVNHSSPGLWVKGADGKVVYGSTTPETKKALSLIRDMYQEGTIDKEFATSKSEMVTQKVASGKAGVYLGPWWSGWSPLADSYKQDPSAIWRAYLLQDEKGKSFGRQEAPINNIAVVKKGFKYPELVVKLLNLYADGEKSPYKNMAPRPDAHTAPVPLSIAKADEPIQMHLIITKMVKGDTVAPDDYFNAVGIERMQKVADAIKAGEDKMGDVYGEAISRSFGFAPMVNNPNYNRVYSEFYGMTPTMSKRWANLKKLESEAFLQIVLGNKPLEYFDEFVQQWNTQGGEQITSEVNGN
ncbi:extracellular solute-binding protein [Paenibacillus sp. FJAT-27812]|uniref:extracellular solute-binding protein n=1 Tax=Paenibacillus sp. FJAT-27812 TaxID=1684143 RepID=UPI0006A75F13|nr:extracellular solute-binding protein [Paenibacillus sp. FJAT-27812]